jgi:hypothetical protein
MTIVDEALEDGIFPVEESKELDAVICPRLALEIDEEVLDSDALSPGVSEEATGDDALETISLLEIRSEELSELGEAEELEELSESTELDVLAVLEELGVMDMLKELDKLGTSEELEETAALVELGTEDELEELMVLGELSNSAELDEIAALDKLGAPIELDELDELDDGIMIDELDDCITLDELDELAELETTELARLGGVEELGNIRIIEELEGLEDSGMLDELDRLPEEVCRIDEPVVACAVGLVLIKLLEVATEELDADVDCPGCDGLEEDHDEVDRTRDEETVLH